MTTWGEHAYQVGTEEHLDVTEPTEGEALKKQRKDIEPWLSAVFQSEHLALLLGSGFTQAVASHLGTTATDMSYKLDGFPYQDEITAAMIRIANFANRETPNIEDQIRVVSSLIEGLTILGKEVDSLKQAAGTLIQGLVANIYMTERNIREAIETPSGEPPKDLLDALEMLVSFLLSFSSRTSSRERLHIFTTNYDRLIEYGADYAGLYLLDRFAGALEPVFRSSRLNLDIHYNPPGIRGEPRYLEGVVRLTKLHGSMDWLYRNAKVRKVGLTFGASDEHLKTLREDSDSVMIYPNSAKDRETSEYPYVELFRDYAAAICRPNSVLVTYGYGFGDEHVNRVIADMLTLPSTHLVLISYNDEGGRVSGFYEKVGRPSQVTLLIGPHFGDMAALVYNYLPKPAIDRISIRRTELLANRGQIIKDATMENEHDEPGAER